MEGHVAKISHGWSGKGHQQVNRKFIIIYAWIIS